MVKAVTEAIKTAIETASTYPLEECLEVLRVRINEVGYDFEEGLDGQKKAYEEALKHYWDIREGEVPLESFDPRLREKLVDLPATRLELDGKTYYIHGLDHGDDSLGHPPPEVKKFVCKKANEYHKPEASSVLFYEDGLEKESYFGIKHGMDFGDEAVVKDITDQEFVVSFLNEDENTHPGRRELRIIERVRSIHDLRNLPKAKELVTRLHRLPEPLTMAYERGDKVLRLCKEKRSEHMARRMLECEGKEVHAIVGYGHEEQIAYFLKEMHKKGV